MKQFLYSNFFITIAFTEKQTTRNVNMLAHGDQNTEPWKVTSIYESPVEYISIEKSRMKKRSR